MVSLLADGCPLHRLLMLFAADFFCFLYFFNLILFRPGQLTIWLEAKI